MNRKSLAVLAVGVVMTLGSCSDKETTAPKTSAAADEALIPFEKFTLDNGLTVIFHVDRSDPVVAVALTAHVGSAREKPGRTGFAHLFEHLLFLESENLGKGGLDKLSARVGGSGANGSTRRDRTNYFQTVPNDALEKMIWAEADKIGFFINTVTEPVLAKEKQVVKNEKRQSVDNRPYGHTSYVIGKNLYPEGHPYNWQVIGSLADLDAATLDDVKEFYRRWYTPNNVMLVIAGDFDTDEARDWVHKYFDEIPRGPEIKPLAKQPVTLAESKRLFHEDNFARLPELTKAWPTVPQYSADSYALDVLADLLSEGKTAPLNEVLIDEKKLTSQVRMFDFNSELAGETRVVVRAFDGVDLDAVQDALKEGFARFEANGIDPADLERVKTTQEVDFYNGLDSVLGKAFNLAQYEIFAGDAGAINEQISKIRSVTADDVMRVYETYIKDKPFVATSFVPKGQADLALEGSARAKVVEEPIVQGAEKTFDTSVQAEYERTPSSFDRTAEPPYGPKPVIKTPDIWTETLENGLSLYGVRNDELPLVRFELTFDGGHFVDDINKPGAANLLAEIMDKGTAKRDTAELEKAIESLGAEINFSVDEEHFVVSGQTLARNLDATMALIEEMLLEPRWDKEELSLAKARVITNIQSGKASPDNLAERAFALVLYGENNILSTMTLGDEASVAALTMDDLKAYYERYLSPRAANFKFVGAVDKADVKAALADLAEKWSGREVVYPDYPTPKPVETSKVYFYDVPGAKQSVFLFGDNGPKRNDPDYYPAAVMNYILGGGGFASRLTQELREGKGYTYGIRSSFTGTLRQGQFRIASGVRSNITFEAADLIKSILEDYGPTFTDADLDVTKSFLLKSRARSFETLNAKLGMLENIADYGLPYDYVEKEDQVTETMTIDRIRALAKSYIRPDAMNYVIVGDAETQAGRLNALGFGEPVMLNDRMD